MPSQVFKLLGVAKAFGATAVTAAPELSATVAAVSAENAFFLVNMFLSMLVLADHNVVYFSVIEPREPNESVIVRGSFLHCFTTRWVSMLEVDLDGEIHLAGVGDLEEPFGFTPCNAIWCFVFCCVGVDGDGFFFVCNCHSFAWFEGGGTAWFQN